MYMSSVLLPVYMSSVLLRIPVKHQRIESVTPCNRIGEGKMYAISLVQFCGLVASLALILSMRNRNSFGYIQNIALQLKEL